MLAGAGCGREPRPSPPDARLTVLAAASLSGAFEDLGAEFRGRHPDLAVRFSFAGSHQIALQIEQGAEADLFAAAEPRWLHALGGRGLLDGAPVEFALNRLVLVLPAANPGQIHSLSDLARPGVKLVLGAPEAPIGQYARELLARLAGVSGYPADFERRALANAVSQEENVKAILAKVALGEADAGFVYRSDVSPQVAARVLRIEVPESLNVNARYSAAVLRGARNRPAARAFVELLRSPEGRRILAAHGFASPGEDAAP